MPTAKSENGNERPCSNCAKATRLDQALVINDKGRLIAVICEECQQAKKIQLTLVKKKQQWSFYQYFPVEV